MNVCSSKYFQKELNAHALSYVWQKLPYDDNDCFEWTFRMKFILNQTKMSVMLKMIGIVHKEKEVDDDSKEWIRRVVLNN